MVRTTDAIAPLFITSGKRADFSPWTLINVVVIVDIVVMVVIDGLHNNHALIETIFTRSSSVSLDCWALLGIGQIRISSRPLYFSVIGYVY